MIVDLDIIYAPLLAGLLVIASHVPLGREVLRRGIIFIDLAVAQVAGLGIIIAQILGSHLPGYGMQILATCSALLCAGFLHWTERHWPEVQEAIIGVTFVLAASVSLLVLANDPHGAEHLQELLVGQILWVRFDQLPVVALIFTTVLLIWLFAAQFARGVGFYFLFAISITISVQLVGIFLVFASLIIPALAVRSFTQKSALGIAYLIGAIAYLSGLLLSVITDLPAGALIVCALVVIAVMASMLANTFQIKQNNKG